MERSRNTAPILGLDTRPALTWSPDVVTGSVGNALTAPSVEGRVPKRNIGFLRYHRQTDCPSTAWQLGASGKLVKSTKLKCTNFDADVAIFFEAVLVWCECNDALAMGWILLWAEMLSVCGHRDVQYAWHSGRQPMLDP